MSTEIYTSEVYSVDPSSIRFDQRIVEFNRVHSEGEYLRTEMSIKSIGQQQPIAINDKTGLCENGRHRVRICKDLGIQVKCIQINGDIPEETRYEIHNLEQMSGKDFTAAQKAIQAHKFAKLMQVPVNTAVKRFNAHERLVYAANTISGLGRDDILRTINEKGYWVDPTGKKVKDLRSIASQLKSETEEIIIAKSEVHMNYEDQILTDKGKEEFWRKRTLVNMSQHELNLLLVEYMNMKYKLKVNEETGEIVDMIATAGAEGDEDPTKQLEIR